MVSLGKLRRHMDGATLARKRKKISFRGTLSDRICSSQLVTNLRVLS